MDTLIFGLAGLTGSGKTVFTVEMAYNNHVLGQKAYSNLKCVFSKKIDTVDIKNISLHDCTIILDEVQTIADARRSMSELNRAYGYFAQETRKTNVTLLYTAQDLRDLECRLNRVAHYKIACEAIKTVVKGEVKTVAFAYHVHDNKLNYIKTVLKTVNELLPYFQMYKTGEVIIPDEFKVSNVSFEEFVKEVETSPNKKAFCIFMKSKIPSASIDTLSTIYDYVKIGQLDKARKILRFET